MTSRTAQRAETKPNYKKLATQVQTGHTGPVKEHKLVNTWQAPVHTQITGFFSPPKHLLSTHGRDLYTHRYRIYSPLRCIIIPNYWPLKKGANM